MSHDVRGSQWHRWDLHFHTPSSFDYDDKSISNEKLVESLIAHSIRVVAVSDHHKMDVDRIRAMQVLGGDDLTVLPAIELRDDHGGSPIHYICIFPEDCDLDHVWTKIQGGLGLTAADIAKKGGDDGVYVPIEDGAALCRGELGGVVSIHAGSKSNSIEGIQNTEQFQRRLKYNITSANVDLMEIGQLKDIAAHLDIIFPQTGLDKPLIICSDNHNANEYSAPAPLWLRADPTFRGLCMVLKEPRDRVFLGSVPPDLERVSGNATKYIRSLKFTRLNSAPEGQRWFDGEVPFNTGLVAIVGNKGSGKSALTDSLGLLGGTANTDSFSFLNENRFRHPKNNLSMHFNARIEWESGDSEELPLSDDGDPQAVERVRYLPQDYVESVCNELAGLDGNRFERELKAVIFSHVPPEERLGHTTLDDLVAFETGEKQRRIDSLLKQLRDESRTRANLEADADPAVRRTLEAQIRQKQSELAALEQSTPEAVSNPAVDGDKTDTADPESLRELGDAESSKKAIEERIEDATAKVKSAERRRAIASRLLEKLGNFEKEFEAFTESLREDAEELGLTASSLVSITLNRSAAEKLRTTAEKEAGAARALMDQEEPPGLRQQLATAEKQIALAQSKLDAPQRAYQAYLKSKREWDQKRKAIEGTQDEPESLKGLQATLSSLDELPGKIEAARSRQHELSQNIHLEKIAQASVYRRHYGAVQHFIDSHPIASDKLHLEFRAELTDTGFADRLLAVLSLNKRGSFMGVDEGRAVAEGFVKTTTWEDDTSVRDFLKTVDTALHEDQRQTPHEPVLLAAQLLKGRRPEEVYDLLFGLEYVQPRYVLRWEGKELSMLSPGERGTLLLIFYLLIDKGDTPLIIDQPEGNLDNHTVAKVLVECIKEASRRRQVFIVTHNPNLAVVCDAHQVVYATMDKADGSRVTYVSGALENPAISEYVTDVLEGTRWAFGVRGEKYDVGASV